MQVNNEISAEKYLKAFNKRQVVLAMEVGDQITLPVSNMNYLRVLSTNLGLEYDRKYSVLTSRADRTVTIIRRQ